MVSKGRETTATGQEPLATQAEKRSANGLVEKRKDHIASRTEPYVDANNGRARVSDRTTHVSKSQSHKKFNQHLPLFSPIAFIAQRTSNAAASIKGPLKPTNISVSRATARPIAYTYRVSHFAVTANSSICRQGESLLLMTSASNDKFETVLLVSFGVFQLLVRFHVLRIHGVCPGNEKKLKEVKPTVYKYL